MAIDIGSFVVKLARKIEATTDPQELLVLTKAISKLKTGSISTVSSYSLLPTITTSIYGEIYLVENEPAFYFAHPTLSWVYLKNIPVLSEIYTWGKNTYSELGDGTTTARCSPGITTLTGRSWAFIGIGNEGSSAIKTDGTLWTWGRDLCRELGRGALWGNPVGPGTVVGGGTNWCFSSIGKSSLGVKTDGTLWGWGWNVYGAVGDGTFTNTASPVTVAGGGTNWCRTSNGHHISAAVKTDGTLWTWGRGNYGASGDGTTSTKASPATVAGGGTTWCSISAGNEFMIGLKTDGTLWTWGRNLNGPLGDGTTTNRSSPGTTSGGGTNWSRLFTLSPWASHSAAVKSDGTLWTWGLNNNGQLGDNTTICRSSPVTTVGGGTTWCSGSGGQSTVSIKTNGTLWTWGTNGSGMLGDGSSIARSSPVTVAGGGTNWTMVGNGCAHTVAICSTSL